MPDREKSSHNPEFFSSKIEGLGIKDRRPREEEEAKSPITPPPSFFLSSTSIVGPVTFLSWIEEPECHCSFVWAAGGTRAPLLLHMGGRRNPSTAASSHGRPEELEHHYSFV